MEIPGPESRFSGTPRWVLILATALLVSVTGAFGLVRATNSRLDGVRKVDAVVPALSPATPNVENYLLVGSDSRAGADPSDPDFANIGSENSQPGMRSDTLMVLRYDKNDGSVALMSVPRDLWVKLGNGERFDKVNAAYKLGPDVVVRTVQRALNIPIHHYLEVDFQGFKAIVDAIHGVEICVDRASRDRTTERPSIMSSATGRAQETAPPCAAGRSFRPRSTSFSPESTDKAAVALRITSAARSGCSATYLAADLSREFTNLR